MLGDREKIGDLTTTEAGVACVDAARNRLGVLWVWPETRFDSLTSHSLLGRGETCAIRLTGSQASREHAALDRDGPLWLLRDLGSKNGTWVNGRREKLARLDEQDVIRIGEWVGVVCALPRAAVDAGVLFETPLPGFVLSAATKAALGPLESLAALDTPLLVYGETGTGKELVVRTIHAMSQRSGRLVAVNCAAVPEGMAEALLFGHRKGAFTGAQGCAEGYVQAARGGTLFLDEVADLPLAVQGKLLRLLEERAVMPLGATEAVPVDFRLVAACHESLSEMVADGTFRADLYARLKGAEVVLPPLRARRQEVVPLLLGFLQRPGQPSPRLDARLVEALCNYGWPYNVRELERLARVLGAAGKAGLDCLDLPESFRDMGALRGPHEAPFAKEASPRRQAWMARHARELDQLRTALQRHDGNVSLAAAEVGVPRHRARRLLAADAERVDAAGK